MLSTPAAAAGKSGQLQRPPLPEALLERRLGKERLEKEQAIKEKEIMQKKMDEMQGIASPVGSGSFKGW